MRPHLHALGIAGIGVSALARHYAHEGWVVSGCDLSSPPVIDGAHMKTGHSESHIDEFSPSLVVYSPALSSDHPELLRARALQIPTLSYPEALGHIAKNRQTIAVSGTHGKSTTTALLTSMFEEGGKDPLAIVGARVAVPGFEENYRNGEGPFVVEGCEYRRGMLHIHPSSTIITNIEADHLDYYKGIEDIQDAFYTYVGALPATGYCVWNKDDAGSAHIPSKTKAHTCSFGMHEGDLHVEHLVTSAEGMTADVIFCGEKLGAIRSPLSGAFNMQNILAAMAMALCHNVSFDAISRAISSFRGIGRRFECLGEVKGVPVYSDYAHHPTALHALANAAEEKFGKGNTLIVFQPHQIDRTKKLSKEFIDVFHHISHLCVTEIYFVAGREHAGSFSVSELVEKANIGRMEPIRFFKSLGDVSSMVDQEIHRYKAVCFAGAGDIDRSARNLVAKQSS